MVFLDMDGTLCSLYEVRDWLPKLRAEETSPYHDAKRMFPDDEKFAALLQQYENNGIEVGVITWGSKDASAAYSRRIERVKKNWLKRHGLEILLKNFHYLEYGVEKSSVCNGEKCFLIDDDAKVREEWNSCGGIAIEPTTCGNVYETLVELLKGGI